MRLILVTLISSKFKLTQIFGKSQRFNYDFWYEIMIEHKSLEFGQANETVFISLGYMYIWTMDISLGGSVVELQGPSSIPIYFIVFICLVLLSY